MSAILSLAYEVISYPATTRTTLGDLPYRPGGTVLLSCAVLPCRTVYVICRRDGTTPRLREVDALLVELGWVRQRGSWLCPEHADFSVTAIHS